MKVRGPGFASIYLHSKACEIATKKGKPLIIPGVIIETIASF